MPGSICFVGHLMLPLLRGSAEPAIGGAEVQMLHLAAELRRRGWSTRFLVCSLEPGAPAVLDTPLGPARVLYPRHVTKSLSIKLREKVATFDAVWNEPAQIVFQRAVWDADIVGLAARMRRRPFVYALASDRDAVALPPGSRRRNALHLAHRVVAQSELQRERVRRYGVRSRVIASGFPMPPWPRTARDEVLWAGTLRALKRPELFLDLAEALPGRRFVLCGGPGEDAKLAARVQRRAEALPNVRFEGFVPYARMQERFARARVLVNTSTYEGFPNTFVQAWMHGAAVLSLGVDPDGRMQKEGLGMVAQDPSALLEGLRRLVDSDAAWNDIVHRARAHAESHHDIRAVTDEYETLFDALVRTHVE